MRIVIHKASGIRGREEVPDLFIQANAPFPDTPTMQDAARLHRLDAQKIYEGLCASLAGGTLDQLTALLMQRVASTLSVPYPRHPLMMVHVT